MNLAEIIKAQPFFQELVTKKENGTFPNAMLFFCEDEFTSANVLLFTALLLEYETHELFNEKSAEFLRFQSGVDLDVKVYPKGAKLLVSDADSIVSECFVRPVNLTKKIFIINNFDISTDEAQNKLLKVLEEPPQNVHFLISAKSEDRVLPTIKSRCEKVRINALPMEEIEKICTDSLACILGEGYIGKTLELSKNDNLKPVTNLAVSLLTELKNSKEVLKFSKMFLENQVFTSLILKVMSVAIEDIIKLKCDSENLCHLKPYISDLKDVMHEYSVEALCEISRLISRFIEKLEFNANITVAVDNFLLKILEVKYLCK